jgi:ABC-type uncharacterized transport system auxiliary subunit
MKIFVILMLAAFLSGCGAATQIAQVQQTQKQDRSCHVEITYNCPPPVVGQPYSCAPTATDTCAK